MLRAENGELHRAYPRLNNYVVGRRYVCDASYDGRHGKGMTPRFAMLDLEPVLG